MNQAPKVPLLDCYCQDLLLHVFLSLSLLFFHCFPLPRSHTRNAWINTQVVHVCPDVYLMYTAVVYVYVWVRVKHCKCVCVCVFRSGCVFSHSTAISLTLAVIVSYSWRLMCSYKSSGPGCICFWLVWFHPLSPVESWRGDGDRGRGRKKRRHVEEARTQ